MGQSIGRTGALAELDAIGGVGSIPQAPQQSWGQNNADFLMALGGMIGGLSHNPNPALQQVGQAGLKMRASRQQGNATVAHLRQRGHDDLAQLVESNPTMAREALKQAQARDASASRGESEFQDWRRRFDYEAAYKKANPDPADGPKFGAAQNTFVDEAGNLFIGTTKRGADGSFETVLDGIGHEEKQAGKLRLVNDLGLSAEEVAAYKAGIVRETEDAKNATRISTEMFGRLPGIRTTIDKMSQVVALVDEGVNTGTIMNMLPSFTGGAKKLDQLRNELGLEVLADGSFGPLSEGEMRFALDTALPTNMEGPELRQWALDRQAAQLKLYDYLSEAAMFLAQPGNSVADLMAQQKGRSDAYGVESKVVNFDEL